MDEVSGTDFLSAGVEVFVECTLPGARGWDGVYCGDRVSGKTRGRLENEGRGVGGGRRGDSLYGKKQKRRRRHSIGTENSRAAPENPGSQRIQHRPRSRPHLRWEMLGQLHTKPISKNRATVRLQKGSRGSYPLRCFGRHVEKESLAGRTAGWLGWSGWCNWFLKIYYAVAQWPLWENYT